MSRLTWGEEERLYEIGVDRGVVYPRVGPGVAWMGLVSVDESEESNSTEPSYLDGVKYAEGDAGSDFKASVEAFIYPDAVDDGSFDFSYRTQYGSGYKIHLVYNALAAPTTKSHNTVADSPEIGNFTWDISTTPVEIPFSKPTAHLVIDAELAGPESMMVIETALYGSDTSEPYLPLPNEVLSIFEDHPVLKVTLYSDGSWTAEGPDEAIRNFSDGSFEIDWTSVLYISNDTYTISSW